MDSPYKPAKSAQGRVFVTPLIVPLSVVMVIVIYAVYVFFYANNMDLGFFDYLKNISFEVFLLCEVGTISLLIYNKSTLDRFLSKHPTIQDKQTLETLKSIIRTNMYSALFVLFFLGLGSLTAIMSILNHGAIKGIIVAVFSLAAMVIINWYNRSEEKVKHTECLNDELEVELNSMLQCWLHKPFPDF